MHTCRLKAGFPTIFEIMSAKTEGGIKYICVSKSNLIIYVADYYTYTYMLKCRLKVAFHTRFVNFFMPVKIVTFCPIISIAVLNTLNAFMST